jgi:tRNA (guanine37-N1)-methyltransferase
MSFRVSVITLTPDAWPGALGVSLIGSALNTKKWTLETVDLRKFGQGKHAQVDDTAAGGGAGMVIRADVALKAVRSVEKHERPIIYLTPRGKPLTQKRVRELANNSGLILFCGRFEGLDERAIEIAEMEEICVGDVILMGGDIAAQLLVEATVRLRGGVLGNQQSTINESFEHGLLEHPLYTKPRDVEGLTIPETLLSGNHAQIESWKQSKALEITKERRPELITSPESDYSKPIKVV